MFRRLSLVCAVLAGTAFAGAALAGPELAYRAEQDCLSQQHMPGYLNSAFAESRIVQAENMDGHAVELYASPAGTWTLVELLPDGRGCVAASGTHLQLQARPTG